MYSRPAVVFEASNATAQAIAIGNAMHRIATRNHDFSDPLELRARILRMAEAGTTPSVRSWRSRAWHTPPSSGDCGLRRARIGSELAQPPAPSEGGVLCTATFMNPLNDAVIFVPMGSRPPQQSQA